MHEEKNNRAIPQDATGFRICAGLQQTGQRKATEHASQSKTANLQETTSCARVVKINHVIIPFHTYKCTDADKDCNPASTGSAALQ